MFFRRLITIPLFIILSPLFVVFFSWAIQLDEINSYHSLIELLYPIPQALHFTALTDYEDASDKTLQDLSLEYLNTHPQLIQRIRTDLSTQEITWHLEGLSHRLLYAPEHRERVAELFTGYCREVVGELLTQTGLPNPYTSISTIVDGIQDPEEGSGIRAFIVHDLAKEYTARYKFKGITDKKIKIELSGRIPVNEVGSYSSYLSYSKETKNWIFTHDRHTIWKSASDNPYTVLMTPLEETLHISLRADTEKAILKDLSELDEPQSYKSVLQMVDNWLAVEEALVGGVVLKLIPDLVIKRIPQLPMEWVKADLKTKGQFNKYRFLAKGIEVVDHKGIKESICLYSKNPNIFRTLLITGT